MMLKCTGRAHRDFRDRLTSCQISHSRRRTPGFLLNESAALRWSVTGRQVRVIWTEDGNGQLIGIGSHVQVARGIDDHEPGPDNRGRFCPARILDIANRIGIAGCRWTEYRDALAIADEDLPAGLTVMACTAEIFVPGPTGRDRTGAPLSELAEYSLMPVTTLVSVKAGSFT